MSETLPHKLAEVAWDRVPSRLPVQYQRCAIASALASKLVYQEGIYDTLLYFITYYYYLLSRQTWRMLRV
jgi:hypothetical protein